MKLIILCGGKGLRFPGSFPKPMNRVWGKMMGEWLSESLRMLFDEVHWILNPVLEKYSIREEIIRWWRGGNHIFHTLPFETREPCETLSLGLQYFLKEKIMHDTDDILVLDNDNYYDTTLNSFKDFKQSKYEAAILIGQIPMIETNRYGYVRFIDNEIKEAREKENNWGENAISYGAYWFCSVQQFLEAFKKIKVETDITKEISLLNLIYKSFSNIGYVYSDTIYSLGTPEDCKYTFTRNPSKFGWKCNIVVDLDNTLITYPTISKEYSTCKEKKEITQWVREASSQGANIIVSTARKMETYNGSIGRVIKNNGQQILKQIEDLQLGENEVLFGKPIGDIYLDDRSINPYSNDWKLQAGTYNDLSFNVPCNFLGCTRDVSISVDSVSWLIKKGNIEELDGQYAYYSFLEKSDNHTLRNLFVKCYDKKQTKTSISLFLENISGVPGSLLLSYSLLGNREWNSLLQAIAQLHSIKPPQELHLLSEVQYQWLGKIEDRIEKYEVYKQLDTNLIIWSILKSQIHSYINSNLVEITLIHGDFWMANILFSSNSIKLIDMRGKIKDICTVYGDPMYDWAKLGTSFLGLDSVVYNLPPYESYALFEKLKQSAPIEKQSFLLSLSLSLMYSALWVYERNTSAKIIELIKRIMIKYSISPCLT